MIAPRTRKHHSVWRICADRVRGRRSHSILVHRSCPSRRQHRCLLGLCRFACRNHRLFMSHCRWIGRHHAPRRPRIASCPACVPLRLRPIPRKHFAAIPRALPIVRAIPVIGEGRHHQQQRDQQDASSHSFSSPSASGGYWRHAPRNPMITTVFTTCIPCVSGSTPSSSLAPRTVHEIVANHAPLTVTISSTTSKRRIIKKCRNTPSSSHFTTKSRTSPPSTTASKPSWSISVSLSNSSSSTMVHATAPTASLKRSPP